MTLSGFRSAGHTPSLVSAFLYFDVSFMAWVMLGPLAPFIGTALHLSATQKGFMVAVPLLGGSFFRPLLGILGDRIGCRRAGLLGLVMTLVPLTVGWQVASAYWHFLALGFFLGIAGASFAVALPLASGWYPPEYQGVAMGIAGAGNSGTLLATLFAPRLATALGFHSVFAIAMIPVCIVLALYLLMAKDSPTRKTAPRWSDYTDVFKQEDCAWFSVLYCMTFGTFVGLASFLTLYFNDQYGLPKVKAGDFATIAVIAGSALRPVGGFLSDRIGGYKLLLWVFGGVCICIACVSAVPNVSIALLLFIAAMGLLGMGNGAVFQMLPQRFPARVGIMTGIVGAAGGLGGFFLPSMLGAIKDATGQYRMGFVVCAVTFAGVGMVLLHLGYRWMRSWSTTSAVRVGLFSYRALPNTAVADAEEAA